jgi:hypothetical protein
MPQPSPRSGFILRLLGACLLVSASWGCARTAANLPLDKELARESFRVFLESWQHGDKPESLKERSPSIVSGDPDWESGKRLLGFRIVDDQHDDGTNSHITVELQLEGRRGSPTTSQLTYVVGTSPVITIFRK